MKVLFLVFLCTTWADDNLIGFTASVYKEIVKTGRKNILVSPLSAEIVLAVAEAGAKDATARELRGALRLPQDRTQIEDAASKWISRLKGDRFVLDTANKVYLGKGYSVKEDFRRVATDVFDSSLENVDFSRSEDAATRINNWVKDRTQNNIQEVVTPDLITGDTVALLVNALYFKGYWEEEFSDYSTEKRDFFRGRGDVVKVKTMHNSHFFTPFNYHENRHLGAQFLEIFFETYNASMVFVLPLQRHGLSSLEARIEDVLKPQNFTTEFVDVFIPKFRIESSVDFKKILKNLGVDLAFTRQADFTGIGGEKGQIFVSDVVQKAVIDVNEKGVEATASTGIKLIFQSIPPTPRVSFVADQPFIYYIKVNGLIPFVGKVSDPQYLV